MLSPRRFMAIAEKSGVMTDIASWAIRRACKDLRAWIDSGYAGIHANLTMPRSRLCDPQLADTLRAALAEWHVEPSMLRLGMTEMDLMRDPESVTQSLHRLRDTGTGLVLMDYGRGLLPASELRRFPFEQISMSCLLVRDMETEDDDAAFAREVVADAHRFGLRVGADEVENDMQCKLLRDMQCDEMQGRLFYRATPAGEIAQQIFKGKALAEHLARLQAPQRSLLLVDDEVNIVAALKRLFRRDGYHILSANSGHEALEVLKQNPVDVIVSDQRMPGMTGTELLHIAKDLYPDTMRIVLSGYTELQSVTEAVNEGAIYKFLTKPWDDDRLREHVAEAFLRKGMADENHRLVLEVRTANQELAKANRRLEEVLDEKQLQIKRDTISLGIVREALQHVPLPVIGLDEDDMVAFVNVAAQALFAAGGAVLGCDARQAMPELAEAFGDACDGRTVDVAFDGQRFHLAIHDMGKGSESRGRLLLLTQFQEKAQ
jgi:EAL domain-containing protein (putative c-di-GMP-specific phosphodiesterase class I)/FixJ family two-component response regulator